MDIPPRKQPDGPARFVVPGLRPSPDRPSRRHVYIGVACLIIGFTCIFFGGGSAVGQALLIAGSIFVFTSLFAFRGFRFGLRRDREDQDIRKLYGAPKV
jgi:drug/metabolite transporter (DMT)-like permease